MSRFNDNGNDTITDSETDLTWFKKDSRQVTGKWLHLEKAAKFAEEQNATNFGGFNDWRIPKLEDVKTIFDKSFSQRDFGNNEIHIPAEFEPKRLSLAPKTLANILERKTQLGGNKKPVERKFYRLLII